MKQKPKATRLRHLEVIARDATQDGIAPDWDLKLRPLDQRSCRLCIKAVAEVELDLSESFPVKVHDEIGLTKKQQFVRDTNRAVGRKVGNPKRRRDRVRGHLKKISTLRRACDSVGYRQERKTARLRTLDIRWFGRRRSAKR